MWVLLLTQVVVQGHQLEFMPSARLVACWGTHLLSVIMAHPPLSTPMPFKIFTPRHSIPPIALITTRGGTATPTPPIGTLTLIPRVLHSHLSILIELPINPRVVSMIYDAFYALIYLVLSSFNKTIFWFLICFLYFCR